VLENNLALLGWIPLIGTALFAFWKGGPAERVGGSMFLIGAAFGTFINLGLEVGHRQVPQLIVDGVLATGFLALAVRYTSLWVGGSMLLLAVQFSLHAYYFVTHKNADYFHALVNNINNAGVLVFLVVGTMATWRQRVVKRNKAAKEATRAGEQRAAAELRAAAPSPLPPWPERG
jgi:hypothetical protein